MIAAVSGQKPTISFLWPSVSTKSIGLPDPSALICPFVEKPP